MGQDGTWHGCGPWSRPHCARWDPGPPKRGGGTAPQFSAHVYCGQTAGWIISTWTRPLVAMAAMHYPAVCTVVPPVNREAQCIIIEITALYGITALYCTSRLTGNARRDNGTHCQDRLPPPRPVGVAMYTQPTMHTLATITISQQNRHSKQLITQRQLYRTCTLQPYTI